MQKQHASIKSYSELEWRDNHEQEWQKLRKTMTTSLHMLPFYAHTKRRIVSTDASKDGIGPVLLEAEGEHCKPVA